VGLFCFYFYSIIFTSCRGYVGLSLQHQSIKKPAYSQLLFIKP